MNGDRSIFGRVRPEELRVGQEYSREELSRLWALAGSQAIWRGVFTPRGENKIVLFVTQKKRADKTQYRDHISDDLLFWEGEDKHGSDQRIVAAYERGDEVLLFYRSVDRQPFVFLGTVSLIWHELRASGPSQFVFSLPAGSPSDLAPSLEVAPSLYPPAKDLALTVRETTIEARRGQAQFRQALLDRWEYRCSVSGVSIPEILRASHIKSWSESNASERLSASNGLLLAPQYDALFDRCLVSFRADGLICLARHIEPTDLDRLGVRPTDRLVRVPEDSLPFLEQHRARFEQQYL